ncbi:lipopolysaccharide biosynthesis protein [Solibacillus sp. FSL W7-1436]|uniref:lipopolysaccharide biosynthesis protein n=1 Tax=Solibacillus sp. FSL W7-1436 TaxID=2921705 RepID=UPI0030F617E7
MSYEINRTRIISSLIWKLLERGGTQGIQFVVQIILARLLLPEEFGIIVLVVVFIAVANVLVQSGFNTALIQKKEVDEIDYSSVFYFNVLISVILYGILFVSAPKIAIFFNEPILDSVLRVLGITLFINIFVSMQNVMISRNLQFKKLFISSLGAVIMSAIVGISMAIAGYGVWALVGQQIMNQLMVMFILFVTVKWRPKLHFSMTRLKKLYSFGWKLLIASLIDVMYINSRNLIIGKIFSSASLGIYNRGEQFPQLIISNINGSIQSVMLPAFSAFQDDRKRVKEMMRRAIVTSSFFIFPMMVGLAVIAEPLVRLLLTEKWLLAVPFIQIFSFSYMLYPIHTVNLQALNAIGRSDLFLKLEIIKKSIGVIILVISIQFGIYAMAWGMLIGAVISSFINASPNTKQLNYGYIEQLKDILPSFTVAMFMGSIIYSLKWLDLPENIILGLQIIIGVFVYIILAKLFKLESYSYLLGIIKSRLKKI